MVIFVTKTSCPCREMTSLALTVCAHIAATHYTPRFCAFEHRFLPFPDLTPNPPSTLPYASLVVEGMERGMEMAPAGMPIDLAGGGGAGKRDVDDSGGCALCLAGGGGDGKGDGDGSGGCAICLAGCGGDGKGDGDGSGGNALGLAVGGGNGRYHALVLSGAEVNPPESLLVL